MKQKFITNQVLSLMEFITGRFLSKCNQDIYMKFGVYIADWDFFPQFLFFCYHFWEATEDYATGAGNSSL